MNGSKIFLDTNIILYLLNGDTTIAELLHQKQLFVSVITELELLAYKGITDKEEKVIKEFLSECKIMTINSEIKIETIGIRKVYNIKLPDSIIIATALYLDLPLITSDVKFKKVKNLNLISYEN